jgi:hypothetical protein
MFCRYNVSDLFTDRRARRGIKLSVVADRVNRREHCEHRLAAVQLALRSMRLRLSKCDRGNCDQQDRTNQELPALLL